MRSPTDDTTSHSSLLRRALEKEVVLLCHRGCMVYRKRIAAAGQLCLRLLAPSFVARSVYVLAWSVHSRMPLVVSLPALSVETCIHTLCHGRGSNLLFKFVAGICLPKTAIQDFPMFSLCRASGPTRGLAEFENQLLTRQADVKCEMQNFISKQAMELCALRGMGQIA